MQTNNAKQYYSSSTFLYIARCFLRQQIVHLLREVCTEGPNGGMKEKKPGVISDTFYGFRVLQKKGSSKEIWMVFSDFNRLFLNMVPIRSYFQQKERLQVLRYFGIWSSWNGLCSRCTKRTIRTVRENQPY